MIYERGAVMKQIIKKPHYEMRCPKCGCHFSFDVGDIENDGTIKCPHCFRWVVIQDSETRFLLPIVKVRFENESDTH